MKMSVFLFVAVAFFLNPMMAKAQTPKTKGQAKAGKSKSVTKPSQKPAQPSTAVETTGPAVEATQPMTEPGSTAIEQPFATADTATPTSPAASEPAAKKVSSEHLFGPSLALGMPHPLRFSFDYVHSSRIFSAGIGYGTFSLSLLDSAIKMTNMEIGLRLHPFLGSFFIGALVGNRSISGEQSQAILTQSVMAKVEVKSNYIAPVLGWMWGVSSSGFFASMDFGYLSPSGANTTVTSSADPAITSQPEYAELERDVRNVGNTLGSSGLPVWTMLRIGYLF